MRQQVFTMALVCLVALFIQNIPNAAALDRPEKTTEELYQEIEDNTIGNVNGAILACLQLPAPFQLACIRAVIGDKAFNEAMCTINTAQMIDLMLAYQQSGGGAIPPELINAIRDFMTKCPSVDGLKCLILTSLASQFKGTPLGDYLNIKATQACGISAY